MSRLVTIRLSAKVHISAGNCSEASSLLLDPYAAFCTTLAGATIGFASLSEHGDIACSSMIPVPAIQAETSSGVGGVGGAKKGKKGVSGGSPEKESSRRVDFGGQVLHVKQVCGLNCIGFSPEMCCVAGSEFRAGLFLPGNCLDSFMRHLGDNTTACAGHSSAPGLNLQPVYGPIVARD